MSKCSILLIPGAFGLPEFYDDVVNGVSSNGYEIKALHLPSVGLSTGPRDGPPPTMYNDAAFIAREVSVLADQGRDVILVAHSYGGVPATESVKGLSKEKRQEEGKKGGIVRLSYLTALVPALGTPAMGVLAGVPTENRDEFQVDEKGWMYHSNHPASAALVFSDLPQEEGEARMKWFPKHSAVSFTNPLTYSGYNDVPVAYLLCEDDHTIPAAAQREGIELIERESGNSVDITSIKTGHVPVASAPQKVVDWILQVAAKH